MISEIRSRTAFLFSLLVTTTSAAAAMTSSCEEPAPMKYKVVRPGTKLNANARFPFVFEGDWERVITIPEVHVVADADTVSWSEGPVVRNSTDQDNDNSVLYYSDTIRAVIYRITDGSNTTTAEVWATQSGGITPEETQYQNVAEPGSNGLTTDTLDPRFVIICQQGRRRVVRCRLDDHRPGAPLSDCPEFEVLADTFVVNQTQKKRTARYNSPNDVVVHPKDGSIWFTDPIYGFLEKDHFCDEYKCDTKDLSYLEGKSEIGWQGVYRFDRETQAVELVTDLHRRPNGLAFTPDLQQLWVADSTIGNPSWIAYDIRGGRRDPALYSSYAGNKAAMVLNSATLGVVLGRTDGAAHLTGGEGLSDGFKIDERGYIWTSIPNGFAVIDPGKREVVCQILLGTNTANVALGRNGDVWLTGLNGVWKLTRRTALAEASSVA